MRTLGTIGNESACQVIASVLGDPEARLRLSALQMLAARDAEAAVPLLGQVYLADADPAVRQLAAQLLSRQPSPAARALLAAPPLPGSPPAGGKVDSGRHPRHGLP